MIILDKTIKKISPDIFKAVEKEVLYFQNEFVGSDDLILQDDIFAVPFKTIILRLFEIELLTEKETRDWLDIAARNPKKGILYQIKKHKIGERWQKRTKHVKLSNLKALIIDNDEMELLPEEKINKDLSFLAELDIDEE